MGKERMETMGLGKKWTQEELDYLHDKWGTTSLGAICKHLGRSDNAVIVKVARLGLGAIREADGEMTLSTLLKTFGCGNSWSWHKQKLLSRGLPTYRRKQRATYVTKVRLNDFWKWAEKNKDALDWGKLEENILGEEPEWVKERRKIDYYNKPKFNKPWSKLEDDSLKHYVGKGMSYAEIVVKMDRSSSAVRRRCYLLGLVAPRREKTRKWTPEEIALTVEMKTKGYSLKTIAEKLNRGQESVRGKLEHIKNPLAFTRAYREARKKAREAAT